MPSILAPRRQRQVDVCEFQASLVYRASSRTAKTTQRNPVSKNQKQQTNEEWGTDLNKDFSKEGTQMAENT